MRFLVNIFASLALAAAYAILTGILVFVGAVLYLVLTAAYDTIERLLEI